MKGTRAAVSLVAITLAALTIAAKPVDAEETTPPVNVAPSNAASGNLAPNSAPTGNAASGDGGSAAKSAPQSADLVAPGTVADYDCVTEAIGMDFAPFKKTNGTIRFTISRNAAVAGQPTDPKANAPDGTWRVSGNGETHVASITKLAAETCANGCPLTLSEKGEAMLWAPGPMPLEKLGEVETLTIAVVRPQPLSVSISTFRGRDIVALEKGTCRKAYEEPQAPSPGK